jgi:cell division protein ZapA
MSSTLECVRVNIFGDEYSIRSNADIETVKEVAEYVNLKISEVKNSVPSRDRLKIAILSAMNISEELFTYKEKCREYLNRCEELEKKAREMGKRIEKNMESL